MSKHHEHHEEAKEAAVEMAAETMTGDLLAALVDEFKHAPDVWQKMPEHQQQDVIYRLQQRIQENVREAVQNSKLNPLFYIRTHKVMNAQVRPSAPLIYIENLTLHLPSSSQLDAVILPFERTREATKARQRYTKIGEGLTALSDDASDHKAVFDSKFNLYRAVGVFPDALDSADTDMLVAKLNTDAYLGLTTWRRPTLEEEFGNADHTLYNPACDTNFFTDAKSSWYRTSTPYPADPSDVFVVSFDGGGVDGCYRGYKAFCRPVASASQ